ncbi:MAG: hypothetical protein M3Y22_06590, partial [Pseudomonadota bacterium]|nr:hypothetical protein [Pseudomonadota bacterium]
IARADELEEDRGLGLAFLDVGEVVEDQQAIFVELLDGGGQAQWTCNGFAPVTYLIMPPWLRTRAG